MASLKLFTLFSLLAQINCECIQESDRTLLCTNEFIFYGIYPRITTLKLNGCFIARKDLQSVFPALENVYVVVGSMRKDQCKALEDTKYEVYGCNNGKILLLRCMTYILRPRVRSKYEART